VIGVDAIDLTVYGWTSSLAAAFWPLQADGPESGRRLAPGRELIPGRVIVEHRGVYVVATEAGEITASVAGRLRHRVASPADFPSVGDWVAVALHPGEGVAVIHAVLPRSSRLSRKEAGRTAHEQVLAANVDTILVVAGLDGDFNLRRLERYLALAWSSGIPPAVVLNKADLCDEVPARILRVAEIAGDAPVHAVSALTSSGLLDLDRYLAAGRTVALLGSSGVGKSTLINSFLGAARQSVAGVRLADSRGRHTTTRRELVPLAGGGLVIDTPGMRELSMWDADAGLDETFAEIESLAAACRFRDCQHTKEPGCAVRAAVAEGRIAANRLESRRKLREEYEDLTERLGLTAREAERRIGKMMRESGRHTMARRALGPADEAGRHEGRHGS
jgi:ribosome biogenesis GTPase / thiamine phosphate phosphatase